MVTLTGELLSPLVVIFIPLIVLLFAFRKEIPYGNVIQLVIGIIAGIGIYVSLMYASTFPESKTWQEIIVKLSATLYPTFTYVYLVAIIGMVTLYPFFTKRKISGVFSGIAVSFAIFEVYFTLRCFETIPFMENFGKHIC